MWRKLSDGNKKTYVTEYRNAKQKYDKFLENIYGAEPLTYKSTEKTNKFSLVRLRGVFGLAKKVKPIDKEIYPGLVKVLVLYLQLQEAFLKDLGKAAIKTLKNDEKRILDTEALIKTVEDTEKFSAIASIY